MPLLQLHIWASAWAWFILEECIEPLLQLQIWVCACDWVWFILVCIPPLLQLQTFAFLEFKFIFIFAFLFSLAFELLIELTLILDVISICFSLPFEQLYIFFPLISSFIFNSLLILEFELVILFCSRRFLPYNPHMHFALCTPWGHIHLSSLFWLLLHVHFWPDVITLVCIYLEFVFWFKLFTELSVILFLVVIFWLKYS